MVSEELIMIERVGVGAAAFVLTYLLLRRTQDRSFAQADKILEMAETTIKENTIALGKMYDGLLTHMQQKEGIITEMKECRRERDVKFNQLNGFKRN